jgi:opacity protein-like surface antigen
MRALSALCFVAIQLHSLPATASKLPPLTASFGLGAQVVTNRAYDMVDDNDHLAMVHVGAGYGFELAGGTLELELGYQGGSTSAPLHGGSDANLWLRGLELNATYRYPLARYFEPYARLGAGVDWATLSLNDGALNQRVSVLSGSAMLGFNVPLVASKDELGRRRTRLALDVGLGYAQRQAADFNALAPEPPDKVSPDTIGYNGINLGKLFLSGITYRIGLTARL